MKRLLLILAIGVLAPRLSADPTPVPEPRLTQEEADSIATAFGLQEIVVTGTRTPKALKDTPIQTRLITEEEIRQVDANDIQDLLQQELPGVEFSYAMNQQTNLNLAGFSGQGVLVLLDGERLAGETMENTDFSRLNMSGVSRIEIIRGASSALYGSNANGGVINIISKEASEPWRVNLNMRAGAHNEWRAGAELAAAGKHLSNSLYVNYRRIDTYDVCLDTQDLCDFRTVYGYHLWNFKDRLVWRPLDNLRFTARAGYFFKQRLYNPDTPDRYRDFSAGLKGEWDITPQDRLEVAYSFDQYDKSDLIRHSGLDVRDYSNVQNTLRALYTRHLRSADILTIGSDLSRDYLLTYQFGPGETHSQLTADVLAQYDWCISDKWELVGALRWDYFSDGRKSQITGKLGARYNLGALTLRAGYAGGFRAPTLKEKYMNFNMSDIFDIYGNPDLRSEKSNNFNISGEYSWLNYYFTLGANYNMVHDRITTSGIRYSAASEPYIEYLNVKDMQVFGVDATVRAKWLHGLSASVSYNFTHEETAGASLSQYCPARPHSLTAKGSWYKRWHRYYATTLTLSGRFLSKVSYSSVYMYEPFDEKVITNPAYTLWKVQLVQDVWKGLQVTLAVDNLFNYTPAIFSYNAPVTLGTTLQVGLSVDIDKFFR